MKVTCGCWLFPSCGFHGLKSSHQAWCRVPLPPEPPLSPTSKSKYKSVVDCKDAVMVQIHCQQDSESPGKQGCF